MSKKYMLVTYIKKIDGRWDEITDFKDKLKPKDLQMTRVILDLHEKKIVKNSFNPDAGFEDMMDYYKRVLGDQLTPYLD